MAKATSSLLELVRAPVLQTASIRETEHRPWPLPRRPWLMGQSWLDLLFAHWRVPAEALRQHVPESIPLDRFDGDTWLGVTPFEVAALRLSFAPPLVGASRFPELNVRTYVSVGGKPGVYFFSLDADSALAVAAARRFYRLPYFRAEMSILRGDRAIVFTSSRPEGARFEARYSPRGEVHAVAPGTLEHFLTERYCLYTTHAGRIYRAEIHHPPWGLCEAEGELELEGLLPAGITARAEDAPLLHFSPRQDVLVWRLEQLREATAPAPVRRPRPTPSSRF